MKTKLSRIVQGCMGWGVWGNRLPTKEMAANISVCAEAGITSFDHADIYGDYTTEAAFGRAFAENGMPRGAVQLISKCGIQYVGRARKNEVKHYQYDAGYIVRSVENSLKNLRTEYLDVLLLHRPSPLMQPEEIEKAVLALKESGKITDFGVSNFTLSQTALIATKTEVCYNQVEYSLTHFKPMLDGSLDYMLTNKTVPMCWNPLGAVLSETTEKTDRIKKVLKTLSGKYGLTADQLLLLWVLKH
ncbi:MAG: aldo/keto reductase, partial [Marinirhabdus sp.]